VQQGSKREKGIKNYKREGRSNRAHKGIERRCRNVRKCEKKKNCGDMRGKRGIGGVVLERQRSSSRPPKNTLTNARIAGGKKKY